MDHTTFVYAAVLGLLGLGAVWYFSRDEGYDEDYDQEGYAGDAEDYEEGYQGPSDFADDTYTGMNGPVTGLGANGMTTSTDLLPKPHGDDHAGDWAEYAPNVLEGQNFLDAGRFAGENTMCGTSRNSNLDLRGSLPIPKAQLPFWNSPIVGDTRRSVV